MDVYTHTHTYIFGGEEGPQFVLESQNTQGLTQITYLSGPEEPLTSKTSSDLRLVLELFKYAGNNQNSFGSRRLWSPLK